MQSFPDLLQRRAHNCNKQLNKTKILHKDLAYTLYQGSREGSEICVKKFTDGSLQDEYVDWYVNEVVVASQLSKHKNVLKFLGCCLETQHPTLVYEFAANGNLSDHLFGALSPLSWRTRLRITTEIAEAVSYVHEGASKAIIHRDIKSRNIFLDKDLVVKLFEFGLSLPVPPGEEHVDAQVVGSFGFIAPESHATGRFTEKGDVYSFGAVLFEIFTGKRACDMPQHEYTEIVGDGCNCNWDKEIDSYIRNAMTMSDQGNNKQRMECAELTRRCLSWSPDQRPTIKEAAKKLKHIRRLLY